MNVKTGILYVPVKIRMLVRKIDFHTDILSFKVNDILMHEYHLLHTHTRSDRERARETHARTHTHKHINTYMHA